MRVNEAKTSKTTLRSTKPSDVRQHQLGRVAHDDRIQVTGSMNEHAHLATGLERNRNHRPRQF
jgi:hypothetical protein